MGSKKIEIIATIVIGSILIALFLYYGYRDDYRRDKKGFLKTIVGVPMLIAAVIFGADGLVSRIKNWDNKSENKKIK